MFKNKNKLKSFQKDLLIYLKKTFPNTDKYFCLIYGSYCYGLQKEISDIDLILIIEKITKKQRENFAKFIIKLHRKYGLSLDDEVPHVVKTAADYKDLESCFNADGFEKKNKLLKIPKVRKTKKYLSSRKIALRLLLNILTSNCIKVLGNKKEFNLNRELAYESLIRIIILNFKLKSVTPEKLVNYFMSDGKVSGEDYLGYKDYPPIRRYLKKQVIKILKSLVRENVMKEINGSYLVMDKEWLYKIFN